MKKNFDYGMGYDESSSSTPEDESGESGGMFNRKVNYTGDYYHPKMSKTGNKYDVNNPSYSKTIFSGNKMNSNFGLSLNSYNNMNFGSTFGPKKDDMYNIDLNLFSSSYVAEHPPRLATTTLAPTFIVLSKCVL